MTKLDKIFNPFTFLIINLTIIILALTIGGGRLFFDTGIIHIIAVFFILLSAFRIVMHYYTYDPVLEKFVHAVLAAMAIFAISHIVEFASLMIFKHYEDSVFINVANFYLISLFVVISGASHFLEISYPRAKLLRNISMAIISALAVFVAVIFYNQKLISLEPNVMVPYIYTAFAIIAGILATITAFRVKKLTPIAIGFSNYLMAAIILIVLAIVPNVLYEFIIDTFGVAEFRIIYISHFAFYAALSLFFLAFRKLSYLGGVFEDLKKIARAGKN